MPKTLAFLDQPGHASALIRDYNWAATSLGSPALWPQSLKTTLGIILGTGHPTNLVWGPDLVTFYNDAYRPLLGKIADGIGASYPTFRPDVWPSVKDQIMEAFEGRPSTIEKIKVLTTRGGTPEAAYFTLSCSPVYDESSLVAGVLSQMVETTQSVVSHEALEHENSKLRNALDHLPQMVWSTLPDGYHDFYNVPWYEFTGVPRGSTDGERWNDMFHPDDQERAWSIWRHSLETGQPYNIQYRLRHRSGEYRWCLGSALPERDHSGNILRWYGTCTDIHERYEVEERVKEVSQRLELAVRTHEIGIFDTEVETGKVFWSEELQKIFGYSPGQFPDHLNAWKRHVYPGDLAVVQASFASAIKAQKQELSYSYRMTRCDGQERYIEASARFFYDENGKHVRRVGVNIDVTERKLAEQRLSETQAELLHLSRLNSLGAMASSLSHELNQPLTAIANYVAGAKGLLQHQKVEAAIDALELASSSTLRAGNLIKRLRDLSRKGKVELTELSLVNLIHDTAQLALHDPDLQRVSLATSVAPDAETAIGDPVLLQQVFFNLFRNAAQAMAASGGQINVTATREPGNEVLIKVADQGPGLEPEVEANLFSAFVSTKAEGMGVGLSICRTIVENSGGRIWARSDESGATFLFTIPAGHGD